MSLRTLFICLLSLFVNFLFAQYSIKGRVNLNEGWQPKIFMASINKLSDYYRTSPDMIVGQADVNPDGTFELFAKNLPNESRYYRIYMMKEQNTDYDACLYVGGEDHNFVHILLKAGEQVEINASPTETAPFGKYEIKGQNHNHLMHTLGNIIFPRFYFYRIKFPSELKLAEASLQSDLKNFTDTCSNILVALAAINNMDFDEYFDRDPEYFEGFGERLQKELPNSIYTKNYLLKVKYHANEDFGFPIWAKGLLAILSLGILGLLYLLNQARSKIHHLEALLQQKEDAKSNAPIQIDQLLTQKEKEILQLISTGKSNKEIASSLFVELSTVKTHINKIYSKIGVSNRKEAQALAKQAFIQ